jgi:hypothetical protein
LGQPIKAEVSVLNLEAISDYWHEQEDLARLGWFSLRGLPAQQNFQIALAAEGFENKLVTIAVETGSTLQLGDLPLRPLLTMGGAVLNTQGEGVVGAEIRLLDQDRVVRQLSSGDRGAFWITDELPGSYRLQARLGDRWSQPLPGLDLEGGGDWHGAGLEVAPTVEIRGQLQGPQLPTRLRSGASHCEVSDDGDFSLSHVFAGPTWLIAEHPGGAQLYLQVSAPFSGSLAVPELKTLQIRLPHLDGWAAVAARASGEHWISCVQREVTKDSRLELQLYTGGSVEILAVDQRGRRARHEISAGSTEVVELDLQPAGRSTKLPAGSRLVLLPGPLPALQASLSVETPLQVAVAADLAAAVSAKHPLLPIEILDQNPPLLQPLERRVAGRVLRPGGEAVAGAWVSLRLRNAASLQEQGYDLRLNTTLSRPDGTFELAAPESRVATDLWVEIFGTQLARQATQSIDHVLEVNESATWMARVVDAEGNGLSGARVTVRLPADWGVERSRFAGTDGSVLFRDLPLGRYQSIEVAYGDLQMTTAIDVTVEPGSLQTLPDLVCYRPGPVQGRIVDERGLGVESAAVQLEFEAPQSIASPASCLTDAEGRYHFENMPPPPYKITVDAESYPRSTWRQLDPLATLTLERRP